MHEALPLQLTDVPWPAGGDDPWGWLNLYPSETALILLGSRTSAHTLLALAWDLIPSASFLAGAVPPLQPLRADLPYWTTGTLGLLSYDLFSPSSREPKASHSIVRIRRSLVLDQFQQRASIAAEKGWEKCSFRIPLPWEMSAPDLKKPRQSSWKPMKSEESYLAEVASIIEEIRDGRYYQLNLLRYWQDQGELSRSYWALQGQRFAGPFAAYLDLPELSLVSFSPERFFRLENRDGRRMIQTEPIKGTRPVYPKPSENEAAIAELAAAPKDRAELNMIVDLMRNDLNRVCKSGSVAVRDRGSVQSFPNVHHLVAKIEGELIDKIDWHTLLTALCPGGSITGAPKREVMHAIQEREGRNRGYFMGNLLFLDSFTGRSDASILIRTATKQTGSDWEFAAGSGLVIHSNPLEELEEVRAKAQVVLANLGNP